MSNLITSSTRTLTVHPGNIVKYSRDEDSAHLEEWMRKRGFINPNEDDIT